MITKKNNNNFMIGAAIFIVLILIISGLYFVYGASEIDTIEDTSIEDITIDDQISPNSNQALLVEINRIRHRGIVDALLSRGSAWKNPPAFFYEVTRDGNTFISKDVSAAGGASNELLFNTWDTMFQENRIQEDIEEEQEFVDVSIVIIERETSGLLGRKSQDVPKETIDVTYDFRTGRWTGDDYLMDKDGYGHYVGDTFEIWFKIYQTDKDADGIPYWTEVNILNTNPDDSDKNNDPDNDGIPTDWEWYWGYDPFTWDDHENLDPDMDGIQNIEEYKFWKYFANPYAQDIYMEVDGMEKGGFLDPEHVFYEETAQIIIERFTEHGINFYIDNGWPNEKTIGGGELLPHYDVVSQESGIMLQFYRNNFDDERKGTFRYLIVGHDAGFAIPSEYNRYDTMVIDSSLYKIYLRRGAFTPRTQRIVLAAAALHELGHTFGIAPWTFQGNDNLTFADRSQKQEYLDTWGDYVSVMNYYYIWDKDLCDYSEGQNGKPYDQNDWENFYLPTFEIDSNAVEDPIIEPPGTDRLINESPIVPLGDDWFFDENLTEEYQSSLTSKCYVENINHVEIQIYTQGIDKKDTMQEEKMVKIYAKPDTDNTYSEWSLIAEGHLDEEHNIVFYNQQSLIDEMKEFI